MTVNVTFRSGPVSAGAIDPNGQAFVACLGLGGDTSAAHLIRSIADFEAVWSTRTGPAVPYWDWFDAAFREGLKQAWVASYATAGSYAAAFALFDREKGPGQLAVLGETPSAQLGSDIANEAVAKGRFALPDVAMGSTLAAMETLGDSLPATGAAAESYMLTGPWLSAPAPAGITGGTSRNIPASALAAGIMARVTQDGNPNRAPGGRDYAAQYVQAPLLSLTSTDRDAAVIHKLNLVRWVNGVLQIDSARTGIPKDPNTPFWQANCSRARMWAQDRARAIGQNYYMKNIDAEGHVAGALKKDLVGMLLDLWDRDGLFGKTAQDAFDVNVGMAVNDPTNAANATLTAVAQMKLSLAAEIIEVDLVSVPILGTVLSS